MEQKARKQTKVFKDTLWVTACVAVYALGTAGLSWALTKLYDGAMATWGVTAGNLPLAPGWIKAIVYGFGAISAFLELVWVYFAGKLLLKARGKGPFSPMKGSILQGFKGLFAGAGLAVLCAAILLLADGVRMGRPLTMPRFAAGTLPYFLALLFSAAAGEWFFRGVLQAGIGEKWPQIALISVLFALFFGLNERFSALNLLNLGLFSALLCLLFAKTHSLWACVLMRAGYLWLAQGVLGLGGAPGLYELYFASRAYLSGGFSGPMAGLVMTALLLSGIAWILRKDLRDALKTVRKAIQSRKERLKKAK